MKNETLRQYKSRVGTTVTQEAITREYQSQRYCICELRDSPINHDMESRRDRAESLVGARKYHAEWCKKVTGWGFVL